jgi:hypothetical protein
VNAPGDALDRLARLLRGEEAIGPHVRDSAQAPALGLLVAAGPRAVAAPADYGFLFEAIREGFLLHYGEPRLIADADPDLRLLAGDYLYALGLERLAERGDVTAVRELGDLISLSAQVQAREGDGAAESTGALWLAAAVAVGSGPDDAHDRAKRSLREDGPDAARALAAAAARAAERSGMGDALAGAADSIGFASEHLFDLG